LLPALIAPEGVKVQHTWAPRQVKWKLLNMRPEAIDEMAIHTLGQSSEAHYVEGESTSVGTIYLK
jgi:hypothetical protein